MQVKNDQRGLGDKLNELRGLIHTNIHEIERLQCWLINLSTAFATNPLPDGWEVRIATQTGMPYWVDHISRQASCTPPDCKPDTKLSPFTLDTLPEYLTYSHNLTQLLDQLHALYLKKK